MSLLLTIFLLPCLVLVSAQSYDYIVVGSGPGGGPLAANLARAGYSTLLLEAGDDQGDNLNVTQVANYVSVINDPKVSWDFFVKHSSDTVRESRYEHLVWETTNGSHYVGLDPPVGARQLGIWYPRAGKSCNPCDRRILVTADVVLQLPLVDAPPTITLLRCCLLI